MLRPVVVDSLKQTIRNGRVMLSHYLDFVYPIAAHKTGQTREMSGARTSIEQARNWLGEVLGALGDAYPYPDSLKPENAKIEEATDKAQRLTGAEHLDLENQNAVWHLKFSRQTLADFRAQLYAIYEQLPADQRCMGPARCLEQCIVHLKEAAHWLGHQLNREHEERKRAKELKNPAAPAPGDSAGADIKTDGWNSGLNPATETGNSTTPPPEPQQPASPSDSAPTPEPSPSSGSEELAQQEAGTATTDSPSTSSPTSPSESEAELETANTENTSSEPTTSAPTENPDTTSSSEATTEPCTESAELLVNDPTVDGGEVHTFEHLDMGEPLPEVTGIDDAGIEHPVYTSKKSRNKKK